MPKVKTAISIQESLFKKADALARKLEVSRSQLFVLALEDFMRQFENRQLLEQINAAHDDAPDTKEQAHQQQFKNYQRRILEGEW
ncbi:MAG: hypothetical protein AB1402_02360 [Bacillota bacterium]|jgi:metal-responsive CopG/Arc/MetJ family transcriptional regulator